MSDSANQGTGAKPTSGMAIAGLVLGVVALISSWVPIVNNMSFFIGIVGAILSIVGLVGVRRGKKSGNGLAVAAVVVNVVSLVVVLATQSAYSSAIKQATTGADVVSTSQDQTSAQDNSANSTALSVGTSAQLSNGLSVGVDSVTTGLTNYNDATITGVQVTITNGGSDSQNFNPYNWKCEDANGVQTNITYFSGEDNALSSGSLAAGGTVSGMLYFEGNITKVLYFDNMFDKNPTATWNLA